MDDIENHIQPASTNDESTPVLRLQPGAWLEEHAVDLQAEAPEVFGGYFFAFGLSDAGRIWTGHLWDHTDMPRWSKVTEGGEESPEGRYWWPAATMAYLGMEWDPAWDYLITAPLSLLSVQLEVGVKEDEVSNPEREEGPSANPTEHGESSMPEAWPDVPVPGAWIHEYNVDFEGDEPAVFSGYFLSADARWGFTFWRGVEWDETKMPGFVEVTVDGVDSASPMGRPIWIECEKLAFLGMEWDENWPAREVDWPVSFDHALTTTEATGNIHPGAGMSEDQPEGSLDVEHGYFLVLKNGHNRLEHGFPYATVVKLEERNGVYLHCIEVDGRGNVPSNALRQHVEACDLAFLGIEWDPAWIQMRVRTRIWEYVDGGDLWFRMREGFRSEAGSEPNEEGGEELHGTPTPGPHEEEDEPDFSLDDIELACLLLTNLTHQLKGIEIEGFEEMEAPDEDDDDLSEGSW